MRLLAKDFFRSDAQSVMVEKRQPQTPFPLHDHEFCEIMIVSSGNGWHLLNDEPHFITCGEVFYISENDHHAYDQVDGLHLTNILYRPDRASEHRDFPDIMRRSGGSEKGKRCHWQVTEDVLAQVKPLIAALDEETRRCDPLSQVMSEALFTQLAVLLSRSQFATDAHGLPNAARLGHVLNYLRHNCTEDIDLESVARRFGYSSRSFSRVFREATATTPHSYLVKLRLSRAMRALLATEDSITDVAFACGFNDSNYFSYSFSRMTGMAPSEYRRMPRRPAA